MIAVYTRRGLIGALLALCPVLVLVLLSLQVAPLRAWSEVSFVLILAAWVGFVVGVYRQ